MFPPVPPLCFHRSRGPVGKVNEEMCGEFKGVKIALGQGESAIAGGADTASDAPLGVNDQLRLILLETRRAKHPAAG